MILSSYAACLSVVIMTIILPFELVKGDQCQQAHVQCIGNDVQRQLKPHQNGIIHCSGKRQIVLLHDSAFNMDSADVMCKAQLGNDWKICRTYEQQDRSGGNSHIYYHGDCVQQTHVQQKHPWCPSLQFWCKFNLHVACKLLKQLNC